MQNAIIISIITFLVISGILLARRQQRLRKEFEELKNANTDLNIEFGSQNGIELIKKNYPELEIKDDWREGIIEKDKLA